MRVTVGGALAAGAAILALAAPAAAASGASRGATVNAGASRAGGTSRTATVGARPAGTSRTATVSAPPAGHVIVVGIGGLRWSDVSPTVTPALWRLAGEGSVGSLVVSGIHPRTCPADGWLTLNAGARAAVPHAATGPCPVAPAVTVQPSRGHPGAPLPARIPRMPGLVGYNAQFDYNPQWGLLAAAPGPPGPGRCATAVGPGAALALAGPDGRVASYLPSVAALKSTGAVPVNGPGGESAVAVLVPAAGAESYVQV